MWNSDGSKLLCGDSQGNLNVLGLDNRLLAFNEEKSSYIEEFINSGEEPV